MSKSRIITEKAIVARKEGHSGLFTLVDLAYFLKTENDVVFRNSISKLCKANVLTRVAKGIYEHPLALPDNSTALYTLINLCRPNDINYISLESELSHIGVISQILMDRVTVMTKGRTGKLETIYGIIEYTHTKKEIEEIADQLYYDPEVRVFRANETLAKQELRRVGRNVDMISEVA